jgi:hypothetical protein
MEESEYMSFTLTTTTLRYIQKHYATRTDREIAAELKTSVNHIRGARRRNGIVKPEEFMKAIGRRGGGQKISMRGMYSASEFAEYIGMKQRWVHFKIRQAHFSDNNQIVFNRKNEPHKKILVELKYVNGKAFLKHIPYTSKDTVDTRDLQTISQYAKKIGVTYRHIHNILTTAMLDGGDRAMIRGVPINIVTIANKILIEVI